jgi:hypothetical protein
MTRKLFFMCATAFLIGTSSVQAADMPLKAPPVDGDIRIELHRSGTTVNVVWPAAAAAECAAWLRDWLR